MAELLSVPVVDLTRLASRNDGACPRLEVIHVIDGDPRPWPADAGLRVPADGPAGTPGCPRRSPVFADRRILALTGYLESIQ